MMETVCFRCDWQGRARASTCPSCGAPLYRPDRGDVGRGPVIVEDDSEVDVTVDGLPAGLGYNPDTGAIEGTPTEVFTGPITITATDEAGNSAVASKGFKVKKKKRRR